MTGPAHLKTASALRDPDAVYRMIVEAHRGLSGEDSAALNAALVLILANQTGDDGVVRDAIALARKALRPEPGSGGS